MISIIASIPSPNSNEIPILGIRYYGIMIGLGVLVAVYIAQRRAIERGVDPNLITDVSVFAVPAGLIGARIYHVATDYGTTYCGVANGCKYNLFPQALKINEGGLGIPGGLILGTIVGLLVARRYRLDLLDGMDIVAPAIPIAQAIGRLGNYFNQELFGRPTNVPWGLEIDPQFRPTRYIDSPTFHPTFAYEALWNVALCLVLIRVDRSRRLAKGSLFFLWFGGYWVGRLWVESMRSDDATMVLGMRVNTLMALIWITISAIVLVVRRTRTPEETALALAVTPFSPTQDETPEDPSPPQSLPQSESDAFTDAPQNQDDGGLDPSEPERDATLATLPEPLDDSDSADFPESSKS